MELRGDRESGKPFFGCAFLQGGKKVAAVTMDGGVWVAEGPDWRATRVLDETAALGDLAVTPEGTRLARLGWLTTNLDVWDVGQGKLLREQSLRGLLGPYNQARFRGDGIVVNDQANHTIVIRDLDGQNKRTLGTAGGQVTLLVLDPTGSFVAAATEDGTISVWKVQ